jgi:hypothetical protein
MEEQITFSQALEKLPDGITFPPKLSYDKDKKTLILAGQLTEDERNALLRMSADPAYCHAVEQLYRISQVPAELVWKESTDEHFVTESVAAMSRFRYILLTAWFIVAGTISIWGLFTVWPASSSPTQEVKSKLDSVLAVQKNKIDSLQALLPTSGPKPGPSAQPATTPVRGTKSDTASGRKAMVVAAKDTTAHKDTTSVARSIFGNPRNENLYLELALLAGILGGAARSLSSLVMYRASRRLFKSWTLWYFGQPVMGGMFALIGLALLKAGLIGNSGVETLSSAGIVAFSALIGLFIDEFTNKLSELFKTLFATKTPPATGGKITVKEPEEPIKK